MHGSAVTKVAIAGNVAVAVLFFAAVMWRIFFTGAATAQEGGAAVSPQLQQGSSESVSEHSSSTPPCALQQRSGGLGKADLLALPVYVHGGPCAETEVAVGADGTVECAVCLGELRGGETGRMLPRCGHRFHAECVDRWFRAHVTCPLCRAVVADGGSGKSSKVQLGV